MQALANPITRDAKGRAINAFVRAVSGAPLHVATQVALRGGVWYEPHITTRPTPADKVRGEFGFQGGGDFQIALSADQATLDIYQNTLRDRELELTLVTSAKNDDGTTREITHVRRAVSRGVTRAAMTVTLDCVDSALATLDNFYPALRFAESEWPSIAPDDVGKLVPDGFGIVTKCPLVFVGVVAGKWRYVGLKQRAGYTYALQAVYRDGRLVNATEYAVVSVAAAGAAYTAFGLDFVRDQHDASGKAYTITYDVIVQNPGGTAHYANAELAYLMTQAGIVFDASVLSPAVNAVVTANEMFADFCYAKEWTLQVLLQNLLMILDGAMVATNAGAWRLWQDGPGGASATIDARIDPANFYSSSYGERPASLALQYRPRNPNGGELQRKRTRAVGGATGTDDRNNPMIYRDATADRIADRMAKKLASAEINDIEIGDVQADFGDRISISGLVSNVPKVVTFADIARDKLTNRIKARTYFTSVFAYTPQPLPSGAAVYEIDYSQTPPAAPAPVTVISNAAYVTAGLSEFTAVRLRAVLPVVNAEEIWCRAINLTRSGTLTAPVQYVNVGGNLEATLTGLEAGAAYSFHSYCTNTAQIEGAVVVTALTAAPYVGVPLAAPAPVTVIANVAYADVPGQPFARITVRAAGIFGAEKTWITATRVSDGSRSARVEMAFAGAGLVEATISGLVTGQAYTFTAVATNAGGSDGVPATSAAVTAASYTEAQLPAPASYGVTANVPYTDGAAQAAVRITVQSAQVPGAARMWVIATDSTHGNAALPRQEMLFAGAGLVAAVIGGLRPDANYLFEIFGESETGIDGVRASFTQPATAFVDTLPLAPTACSVIGDGSYVDPADGRALAFVAVRATPPALWARLLVEAVHAGNGARTPPFALTYNGTNWEAIIGGLTPLQSYALHFYAENSNGRAGAQTVVTPHVGAAFLGAPPTPSVPVVTQGIGNELRVSVVPPTYPRHHRVVWEHELFGGSGWVPVASNGAAAVLQGLIYGAQYRVRAKFVDLSGNQSAAWATSASVMLSRNIGDAHIYGGGVGAQSIALGSVNAARQNLVSGSVSVGPIAPGGREGFSLPAHAYLCSITTNGNALAQKFVLGSAGNKNLQSTDLALYNIHVAGEGGHTAAELTGGAIVTWEVVNA